MTFRGVLGMVTKKTLDRFFFPMYTIFNFRKKLKVGRKNPA